jgi:galactokinase
MTNIELADLELREEEKGTTASLIRGVLAGLKDGGYTLGGFDAYITSDVLIGAGLSSSAAFETLIGTVVSGLYNDMNIDPGEIAKTGQIAQNIYF